MTDKATRKAAQLLRKQAGSKPGKARAANLTAEERREIARKAAEARWHQTRGSGGEENEG